jgi:type IV pilus assembly protein PilV
MCVARFPRSMPSRHRGFSLIEVLVTVVITAIGLLGVAVLLSLSVRQQLVSAIHTQATFVGESLMDRMQSNRQAVWAGAYDYTYGVGATTPTGPVPPCGVDAACDPLQRASRDRARWTEELMSISPLASATVTCRRAPGRPDPGAQLRAAPFDGYCDVDLSWSEPGEEGSAASKQEGVSWRFTP